jgi:outer membrane immunogenic protein
MLTNVMKKLVLTGIAGIALMSIDAAGAADVSAPVTKAPVKAAAPAWSGFYAGGNIGYGWESSSVGLPVSTTDPALAGALAFLIGNGSFPAAMSPSALGSSVAVRSATTGNGSRSGLSVLRPICRAQASGDPTRRR